MKKMVFGICLALSLVSISWAKSSDNIHVDVLAKTTRSWNGEELSSYLKGRPEITILRIQIPPMVKLPLHKHPVINAGVLLKGELTVVTKDQQTLHLKAGDAIVEVVETWHYGKNEGNEPAEIIVFYAGVEKTAITVKPDAPE